MFNHALQINTYRNGHSLNQCMCLCAGMLGNGTWLVFLPLAPVKTSSAGLLILAFVTVMLSITCLLLLCHLLGFHFYLCKSRLSELTLLIHQLSLIVCFLVNTVYKGISTFDYVKMQRQKEARNRDTEAGKSNDDKTHNKAPQVRLDLFLFLSIICSFYHVSKNRNIFFLSQNKESTIDCEPTLSQSSG